MGRALPPEMTLAWACDRAGLAADASCSAKRGKPGKKAHRNGRDHGLSSTVQASPNSPASLDAE